MTRIPATIAMLVALALPVGCASRARVRAQQGEIDQLKAQLAALQGQQRATTGETEQMKNEIFILHDRLETARTALSRVQEPPPRLEVVRLAPTPSSDPLAVHVHGPARSKASASDAAMAAGNPDLDDRGYDAEEDEAQMLDDDSSSTSTASAAPAPIPLEPPGKPDELVRGGASPAKATGPELKSRPLVAAATNTAVAPTPDTTPAPMVVAAIEKPKVRPKGDPLSMYQHAYSLLKGNDVDGAREAFQQFVDAYPQHDYADNAYYWMGECFYTQHQYEQAIGQFEKVPELYPGGNKVPDALLKIGIAYESLDRQKDAAKTLEQLIDAYPQSNAAEIGRGRLAKLRATGTGSEKQQNGGQ